MELEVELWQKCFRKFLTKKILIILILSERDGQKKNIPQLMQLELNIYELIHINVKYVEFQIGLVQI